MQPAMKDGPAKIVLIAAATAAITTVATKSAEWAVKAAQDAVEEFKKRKKASENKDERT